MSRKKIRKAAISWLTCGMKQGVGLLTSDEDEPRISVSEAFVRLKLACGS